VYDITAYLPYHPGGQPKLKLGAGKDCTALFTKYHAWVNADPILSKYCIGVLMNDEDVDLKEGDEDDEEKS
jgi:cytochrome b involved in lipid metabolism